MGNALKAEEYSRPLPNSRWLRNMLKLEKESSGDLVTDKEDGKIWKYALATSTKILQQCVMIPEGKPIYLTEEQQDWLYDYILYANRLTFTTYILRKTVLYYIAPRDGMYYVKRSGNVSLNPIWEKLLESGVDKNVIVFEETHDTTNPEDERYLETSID